MADIPDEIDVKRDNLQATVTYEINLSEYGFAEGVSSSPEQVAKNVAKRRAEREFDTNIALGALIAAEEVNDPRYTDVWKVVVQI
ncbi:hypothetical protein Z052_01860 [Halorubrum sp. C191]|uniref:hypothetical protein n=1 Tax=Halorubrum sp. C191 TaxID=1383842 RepID=UPI000C08806B|nr:hypothetical protein [Halorubrum sp. C191]PHQ43908.1 hypothetical protein Z052_01860 [Halorubrum sp. C191]